MKKKDLVIRVCVDKDEYAFIKREAYFNRRSMSSFVRERIFQNE